MGKILVIIRGENRKFGKRCGGKAGQSGRAENHNGIFAEGEVKRPAGGDGKPIFPGDKVFFCVIFELNHGKAWYLRPAKNES